MKTWTLLTTLILPLTLLAACDKGSNSDKPKNTSDSGSNASSDTNNNMGDGDPVWDCVCTAECDGDYLDFEETVCADASTIDLAIDISVDACAVELDADCVEFSCDCECEEDPDFACD